MERASNSVGETFKNNLPLLWGLPWGSSGYKSTLPMQGGQVQVLVGEQGSHILQVLAKSGKESAC